MIINQLDDKVRENWNNKLYKGAVFESTINVNWQKVIHSLLIIFFALPTRTQLENFETIELWSVLYGNTILPKTSFNKEKLLENRWSYITMTTWIPRVVYLRNNTKGRRK